MDDKELIQRLKNKKQREKAFSILLDLYQKRLYWHIRKIVITHENTNDVLQNTFIKIYKGIGNFKQQSSLHTWMYRIAYNEAIRFLEKDNRNRTLSLNDKENDKLAELTSDIFFDGNEAQLKLQKTLFELPEKQRLIFQMKYYDDLKFKEIAAILHNNENTIKTQYYTAVKHIKEALTTLTLD